MKKYIVVYTFHHSRMGFQNEITIETISENHALVAAMEDVAEVFGKSMIKRFTFKIKA
jgi:hypothetical protein